MNDEIRQLIALQEIDGAIGLLNKEVGGRQQTLQQLHEALTARRQTLAAHQERLQAIALQQRDFKLQIDEAQTRIKERQNKMLRVQTSREHQSLLKEIEDAKQVVRASEEELLGLMEEQENLEQESARLLQECEANSAALEKEEEQVRQDVALINLRIEKALQQRKQVAKTVAPPLLERYDVLLTRRQGIAIIQVKSGVCQGCYMTIPPQQYNLVVKGEKLFNCPTCQRILYYQAEGE